MHVPSGASEWVNEVSGASEWSEQCGASEWVGGASKRANWSCIRGVDLISFEPIDHSGSLKKSWERSSPFADSILPEADFPPSFLVPLFVVVVSVFYFNEDSCEFAFSTMQWLKTVWKPDKNTQMSHELEREWSGERMSEHNEVRERSKQCGAKKTSERCEQASGPVHT